MPPFVRTFVILLIGLPGMILWFAGGLAVMGTCALVLIGSLSPSDCGIFPAFLAVTLFGHVMHTFAGNLLGEAQQRLAADQIGKRLAWDAALDVTGLGLAGAGIALVPCMAGGHWARVGVALGLIAGFSRVLVLVLRKRRAFLERWEKENVPPPEFVPPDSESPTAFTDGR